MKKYKYGYLALTADCFHIGHLRALQKAKDQCDKLIVGIMTDGCVEQYKGKRPIMNMFERSEIINSLKGIVGGTYFQDSFEFPHHILRLKDFHEGEFVIFDSEEHKRAHADIFLPRTKGISSTLFKEGIK